MKVILDTWVFLDPSRSCKALLSRVRSATIKGIVSTVTFAELYSLLYRRVGDKDVERFTRNLERLGLSDAPVIKEIAKEGGRYKAKYGFSIADGIILATGLAEGAEMLVTGDPEFKKVKELKVATPEKALRDLGAH